MKNSVIGAGTILLDINSNKKYRIISVVLNECIMCEMEISKLYFRRLGMETLLCMNAEGVLDIINEEPTYFEFEKLSESVRANFLKKKAIVQEINRLYGPDYISFFNKHKQEIKQETIKERFGVSVSVFYDTILKYFQSGCQDISLLDKRSMGNTKNKKIEYSVKTGAPSVKVNASRVPLNDRIRKIFDEGICDYKAKRMNSFKSVYIKIIKKYFRRSVLVNGKTEIEYLPESEIPSFKQFYNYARQKISPEEMKKIKTSEMEVRNNNRILDGSANFEVFGPGYMLEIDETEVDCCLVSSFDRSKVVSRPILYVAIDVYSRMIVGISVAFDNNSFLGITNLLMSFVDDKAEFCEKYGFPIGDTMDIDKIWPSNFLPANIRVDMGSEYTSKEMSRICNELGITLNIVSPGTGSLKGIVENVFKVLHSQINSTVEGNGLISKRHDSDHREKAVLTIEEYTKMVVAFVIGHNQKMMKGFKLTKEMVAKGIEPIPARIWEYGMANAVRPRPVKSKLQYLYALMKKAYAKYDKRGICFRNLHYIDYSDSTLEAKMFKAGNTKVKIEIRHDPREIDHIYYMSDNVIHCASFRSSDVEAQSLKGMSEFEYNVFLENRKKLLAKADYHNLKIDAYITDHNESVVAGALATAKQEGVTEKDSKHISEHRAVEKQRVSKENKMSNRPELKELVDAGKKDGPVIGIPEKTEPDIRLPEKTESRKEPRTEKFSDDIWDDIDAEY